MKIKFKHKKDCILKAMGSDLTTKDVNKAVNNIVGKFMTDDSLSTGSQLAELIHNELPYEAILFVALQDIKSRIRPDAMERVKRMNKKNEPRRGGLFEELAKAGFGRTVEKNPDENEPSFEGFQKFVEGLIAGLEREEAKRKEDTKPETDETDKGTKD